MSLIEKAAERLEREREAKARGRVPTPPKQTGAENAIAQPPPAARPSRPIGEASPRPDVAPPPAPPPAANNGQRRSQQATPTVSTNMRSGARSPGKDQQTGTQTFRINFKDMEKLGYISRPFARGRLPEDLRAMKQRLMKRMNFFSLDAHRTPGRQQNVIMVSSSWASEGKTFTACNLALSLALEDRVNVLLVDADVIRPSVHGLFGLPGTDGLTDYLRIRDNDLSPFLWRAENAPLSVLPAGSPVQSPRELFRSDEMSRFIYDVSSRYSDRLVIVDTPPLLVTAEAPVLAHHADQIIVVVQAGRTSQTALEDALDLLSAHDNVSLVLNRCNEGDRLTTPGYYGYGYYQERAKLSDLGNQS